MKVTVKILISKLSAKDSRPQGPYQGTFVIVCVMIDKMSEGVTNMENLIKPVDYAKKMGISRQAVYAKIKKGMLPSKNVGGKIYIVLDERTSKVGETVAENAEPVGENFRELLEAKEETISVLKETIRDLKETNRMITSTLRSEVELLKEAFGEMKTLYAARLERIEPETITLAEFTEEETVRSQEACVSDESTETSQQPESTETEWIELKRFFREQGIEKKKLRKRFLERVEKLHKKGSRSVRKEKNRYLLTPRKAARLLSRILETR